MNKNPKYFIVGQLNLALITESTMQTPYSKAGELHE